MSERIIELNCPGCGARVNTGQKDCEWCHKPVVISTFNSVYSMDMPDINKYANTYKKVLREDPNNGVINTSIAMCYLKLKKYDEAIIAFQNAMEDDFDNSEVFFYTAVSLLKGKKAFLQQRPIIDKVLENINAAIMIEPRGIYYYYLAYIKYDYFARKYFRVSPTFEEVLATAFEVGVSNYDIELLFDILSVQKPECM